MTTLRIRNMQPGQRFILKRSGERYEFLGRSNDQPVGYLPAYELGRLHSGHDAQLRSAKFGPSALDGDVPVYLDGHPQSALVEALRNAQCAIQSMKAEAETAAQGDEQMMLDACEQISNEGLEASLAIQAALSTAAQPPADGALNTIAAMFHSGEEIEGPDGLAVMVDMSVWNDALDSFEGIIGDEMEPAPVAQGDALDQGVREELSIGKAINRAARDLPEGWEIRIDLERRAGVVFLIDPDGNETMSEGGELFSDQINAAIDAARTQQEDKSGANHDL